MGHKVCRIDEMTGEQLCVGCRVTEQSPALQNLAENGLARRAQVDNIHRAASGYTKLLHKLELELGAERVVRQ